MSFIRILLCLAVCSLGCVKENRVAADGYGEGASADRGMANGENDGELGEGGNGGDGGSAVGGTSGQGGEAAGGEGGAMTSGGSGGSNSGGISGNGGGPTNSDRGPGCQAYCDRIQTCLVPECPGLDSFFNDEVCDEWCGDGPDFQLGAFADRECADFNDIILGNSPELTDYCSDEDIPDECEAICVDFNECGFEIETQTCLRICRGYEDSMRECAADANTCFELFDCVDETEPEDNINYNEVCRGKCFREVECVRSFCASGTLEVDDAFRGGLFEECTRDCVRERPPVEELLVVFDGMCVDIVEEVRENNPVIDERCDNDEDDTCRLLCEKAAGCGAITAADCQADCANWTYENRRCIDNTPRDQCERMNGCFGDSEGQQRCRAICDYLQGCLLEACPPQIIAPDYNDECTAGCLPEPPSIRLTEEYLNYSCREIRGGVYQDNPGLRPVCDGGQDFRPSADECVDVCERSLDACIPGGQTQCVSLCRSLTREQYTCAVADGATCEAIDSCSTE